MLMALWVASFATVIFLSLWPFTFDPALATGEAWVALAGSWGWTTSRGDVAGNFALFIPVGFLGLQALHNLPRLRRIAIVAIVSLAVSVGAQVGQVYVPERTATMVDVAWNMTGLLPGMALGLAPWEAIARGLRLGERLRPLPWLILSIWIVYRLAPFLPSVDLQLIKDNLKPLLLHPVLDVPHLIGDTASWLAAAYLMRVGDAEERLDRLLPLLIVAVLGAEILIAYRDGLGINDVLGAVLALGIWFGMGRTLRRPAMVSLPALTLGIVVYGLWPFTFEGAGSGEFHWMPFAGLLAGNMWPTLLVVIEKVFLYSATSYALRDLTGSWRLSAVIAGTFLLGIEALQLYQTSHVPEVTDAILVLLICVTGAALSRRRTDRRQESAQ